MCVCEQFAQGRYHESGTAWSRTCDLLIANRTLYTITPQLVDSLTMHFFLTRNFSGPFKFCMGTAYGTSSMSICFNQYENKTLKIRSSLKNTLCILWGGVVVDQFRIMLSAHMEQK